jgi:hypothetical protein
MTELIAKPVLKNKYWIVEKEGSKVGTIQAIDDGGFVYVHQDRREKFPTIKLLSKAYNLLFENSIKKDKPPAEQYNVHGYPVSNKPWNILWDVKHHFPLFTKTSKSKSFYCAGYYIIKFNNGWVKSHCPKFITLNRYQYQGPFKTKEEMNEAQKAAK